MGEWHRWFAWYPVNVSKIGYDFRWMVWVERRITSAHPMDYHLIDIEYRDAE